MPKMSEPNRGLSGSDLERLALRAEALGAHRDFWERSAEVDAIRAISDQDDAESFKRSGVGDAREIAPLLFPSAAALEIGCGTGRVMRHVAPLCRELHGVDISVAMVERGRRHLADLPNTSFEVGNGYDLAAFADESLDLVYSLYAFQHMPKTIAFNYLAESYRVLRTGGVLRFQVPNLLTEENFLAFHHFTQPWFVAHPYPMNYWTPCEVVWLLAHAGFRVEDIDRRMVVVARRAGKGGAGRAILERVASFEHPWLIGRMSARLEAVELAERLEAAELAARTARAELEATNRRKAVRAANLLRHPLKRLRRR
jgi:ubiquinone/menaquinone biosynthesis C-methylase UbiE